MSAISTAAFNALVNSILTSQTAPDSITPTTLDDLFYAVSESYYNSVDGLYVNGMTNVLPGVANGQNLQDILSLIMAAINNQSNPEGMIPYLFRAEKTVDQVIPATFTTGSAYTISFEDDSTLPNFDTSNLFYRDKFVSSIVMTKTFVLEKICLKQNASISDTWYVRLLKNGVQIAASLYQNADSRDEYGGAFYAPEGYIFPSLVATNIALAQGDIITAELVCQYHGTGASDIKLLSGHPAGKPCHSNA